jgi:hypothetical protein
MQADMQGSLVTEQGRPGSASRLDLRSGSNAVRLSRGQWAAAGLLLLAAFALAPALWPRTEGLRPQADYRVPYDMSNDYWLFDRWARWAASRYDVLVLGDSVVWGQYVLKEQTLTHHLTQAAGGPRFANLGIDGMHPVALAGLLEYYGGGLAGKNVLLHCNLLWMSSKRYDLRTDKEFRFYHPDLVPQFVPWIACYTEPRLHRLGIVIGRNVPFMAWADHLKLVYFDKMDLPTWSLEHPYANPLAALLEEPPLPEDRLRHEPISWTAREIERQTFAWVDLDTSLQWRFFRQAVETLRRRGNKVFVLVGPFNEPMLTAESLAVYTERKRQVEAWLRENGIPCCAAAALPSEQYADASHPLGPGYALLAKRLLEEKSFAGWMPPGRNASITGL